MDVTLALKADPAKTSQLAESISPWPKSSRNYLAEIRIRNYRCFADEAVAFVPGVNGVVGETNAGKTTILSAFGLLLDQRRRHRPGYFDFHQPVADLSKPPRITISLLLRSTKDDTLEDKALVADCKAGCSEPYA